MKSIEPRGPHMPSMETLFIRQPARVNWQIYSEPAIFELELQRIFGVCLDLVGHESQVKTPPATISEPSSAPNRSCWYATPRARSKSSIISAPTVARSLSRTTRQYRRIPMLLPWLDLSLRRPAQGDSVAGRLSTRLQSEKSEHCDDTSAARKKLSRFCFCQRSQRRTKLGGIPRPHDDLARRHGRPRPTAKSRLQAACSSTRMTVIGKSTSRTCAMQPIPSSHIAPDRRGPAAIR